MTKLRTQSFLLLGLLVALTFSGGADAAYVLDDGTPEAGIGYFGPVGQLWINAFQAQAGEEQITTISIMFGANPPENGLPANGTSFELVLFTDPSTEDGDPVDAVLQRQQTEVIANSNTATFVNYTLNIPITLGVGEWFFVGMFRATPPGQNVFGPNTDTDGLQANRSHRFGWFDPNTPDLNDLSGSGASASPDTGRNFMIRASGEAPSSVPEPSTFLLFGAAAALALLKRRR